MKEKFKDYAATEENQRWKKMTKREKVIRIFIKAPSTPSYPSNSDLSVCSCLHRPKPSP